MKGLLNDNRAALLHFSNDCSLARESFPRGVQQIGHIDLAAYVNILGIATGLSLGFCVFEYWR